MRALADRDYAPGHFGLAAAYRDGAGVRRDDALSLRHFLAAAERGCPSAECMLGNLYATATPRSGVCEYDPARGVQWWRRAADRGNAGAQRAVADARVAELKAKLPLPWSDHLRYWMILAKEAGIQSGSFG